MAMVLTFEDIVLNYQGLWNESFKFLWIGSSERVKIVLKLY